MCRHQVGVYSAYRTQTLKWHTNPNLHVNSLAYAELFLTLATVLSRFDMKIYKTTTEDVRVARDYFVGVPEPGSQGVRVTMDRVL